MKHARCVCGKLFYLDDTAPMRLPDHRQPPTEPINPRGRPTYINNGEPCPHSGEPAEATA